MWTDDCEVSLGHSAAVYNAHTTSQLAAGDGCYKPNTYLKYNAKNNHADLITDLQYIHSFAYVKFLYFV